MSISEEYVSLINELLEVRHKEIDIESRLDNLWWKMSQEEREIVSRILKESKAIQ